MKTRILYFEDEPFLGRIVKESLETRSFEVIMLQDGKTAAPAFNSAKPDICILDVMLPSRDGYSIAKDIREIDPAVPIIFVTARTQTEDLVKGFESGGNDYIRKPFSMEELIVRIDNLLKLKKVRRPGPSEKVKLGKYEFNPLRYEITNDDYNRKLSHREAKLLMMLVENKNAITSRKDILMEIWGDDSFFNSRNLDVYITKLRDVFKADSSIQIITIKGVGYHFAVE